MISRGALPETLTFPKIWAKLDTYFLVYLSKLDKTGTLTQNDMIFKKLTISMETTYSDNDIDQIKNILRQEDFNLNAEDLLV